MMMDMMKKTMLAGVGLAAMTRDKIEEIGAELVRRGELTEKEGKEFVDEMATSADRARKDFESRIDQMVQQVLERLHVATRQDVDEVLRRLDALEEKFRTRGSID